MTTESTSKHRLLTTAAWVGVALLFGQALAGNGTLPGHVFDPLVRWYAENDQTLRASSFIVALISLGVLSALAFGDTAGSRRWAPILAGLLLTAVVTSSAELRDGDLLDVLQKLAQLAATLVGVYLVLVAGPRELLRWRRTKYDERCAEAAAAALVATEELLSALDAISSPGLLKGDPVRREGSSVRDGMRHSSRASKSFQRARTRTTPMR
jgi:hypothetical protein